MKSTKRIVNPTVDVGHINSNKNPWRDGFILLGLGFMYLVWIRYTGIAIPCPIRTLTKLYCPGCGITRMFVSLSKLDILMALQQNALVLLLLPYGIFSYLRHHLYERLYGVPYNYGRRHSITYIAILVIAILFAILRNLPAMEYLRP